MTKIPPFLLPHPNGHRHHTRWKAPRGPVALELRGTISDPHDAFCRRQAHKSPLKGVSRADSFVGTRRRGPMYPLPLHLHSKLRYVSIAAILFTTVLGARTTAAQNLLVVNAGCSDFALQSWQGWAQITQITSADFVTQGCTGAC